MELSVFNIKGEDTGRKVTLNDAIFGIEPNDQARLACWPRIAS